MLSSQLQFKQVLQTSELKEEKLSPLTTLPLPGVVTSILPMSHQGASGPGYQQTIVSSEVSTYRAEREVSRELGEVMTEHIEILYLG